MDRTFLADVSEIPPSPPETPLIGYPRNGDPASGVRATKPGAWWYHMIEEEILNVIRDAGLTPDPKKVDQLVEAINKRSGVPVGTVEYFAMDTPPAGYLTANGSAVGRTTYPDLFAAIGTTFGAGDGATTFNLPNLIGRFAEGSATPGVVKEAGLPDIIGSISNVASGGANTSSAVGALSITTRANNYMTPGSDAYGHTFALALSAADSNPIYGASDTVQPPALTLLPCIKAFDATVNSGLIDVTELAQEVANKTDSIAAAHAAMPSDRYIELTLPASGGTVTAPADGYFVGKITASNTGSFSADTYKGGTYIASHLSIYGFGAFFLFFSVAKGNLATFFNTTTGGTINTFKFVYAEGSQP